MSLNELNVTRDVLDFKYRLKSDVDAKKIQFDIVIKNWTADGMVLWLNFTEPELVSVGSVFDQAYVKVINENLFVSKDTGIILQKDYEMLSDEFPEQIPANIDINNIYIGADTVKYSAISVGIIFAAF